MDKQIANEFDPKTIKKIITGALIAVTGGIAVAFTASFAGVDAAKALLLAIVSTLVPTTVNATREYLVGE